MRIPGISIAVFAISIAALPASALAQVVTPAVEPQASEERNTWMSLSYAHLFETDLDNTSVEVKRNSLLAIAGHRFALSDSVGLLTQAAYQLSAYDFSGDGGVLWKDINQVTTMMMIDWRLDEHWSVLGGGLFRFSGEAGADFGDSLTGGGFGGFQYTWSENLRTGFLLGAMSQIEDDAAILPLPLVTWKFAESWMFRLGVSQLGAVGYGPELSWMGSEKWELGFGASYQSRRYRLDQGDLVGEETSMPIYARLGWHPTPSSILELMAGVAVAGEIRQETSRGSKIFNEDTDPSATISLRGNIRF
ncbi:MAG: hypothetical protein IH974_11185 [Myxococcales bacterium]|nr:hypothetical protein [Myxococcales bacterium]